MTAIVGIAQNGKVWMGGDRFQGHGSLRIVRSVPKVCILETAETKEQVLLGCAGDCIANQIAQLGVTLPPMPEDDEVRRYVGWDIVGTIQDAIAEKVAQLKLKKFPTIHTLIGFRGKLYSTDSNFSVLYQNEGIWAIGSGDELALGAMYGRDDLEPRERILHGLAAAEAYSSQVVKPFDVLSIGGEAQGRDCE